MKFRHKAASEIIAVRKEALKWRQRPQRIKSKGINLVQITENRLEHLTKKEHFNNNDKLDVLEEMQKKFRIAFNFRFPLDKIKMRLIQEVTTLEKCYDCTKKSYFIIKGTISVLRSGSDKEELLQGQRGIGLIFSDYSLVNAQLTTEKALLLQIRHSNDDLQYVEYNILMTLKEKEMAVRPFPLFHSVDNLHKHYLSSFTPLKYLKGDYIYKRDSQPDALFLIIQGEVSFESIRPDQPENQGKHLDLIRLLRRKAKDENVLITEILTAGSYFGEEEILNHCNRIQHAKCSSISCLLLSIPLQKIEKLLTIPQFFSTLQTSSHQRSSQRQKILYSSNTLTHNPLQKDRTPEHLINYQTFKHTMHANLSEQKDEQLRRLTLGRSKKKIMHGHSVKVNRRSCEKEPMSFSMLEVNEETYQKTIKRFRYSLKEIQREKHQKVRTELTEGRTLLQFWNTLQLQQVFNPEKLYPRASIQHLDSNGLEDYQQYTRLSKHLKTRHTIRPKGSTTNCRLKQEYIKYLQELS